MTASDATQFAWEGDQVVGDADELLFTHFLIEGLQTGHADSDGDGQVSLDEWYDYAFREIIQTTPKQKPQKFAERQQGQMVIAHSIRGVTRLDILPSELTDALNSPIAFVRRGAVDELGRLLADADPALAQAAHHALERLATDDSQRVSQAALAALMGTEQVRPPISKDEAGKETTILPWKWIITFSGLAATLLIIWGLSTFVVSGSKSATKTAMAIAAINTTKTAMSHTLIPLTATRTVTKVASQITPSSVASPTSVGLDDRIIDANGIEMVTRTSWGISDGQ